MRRSRTLSSLALLFLISCSKGSGKVTRIDSGPRGDGPVDRQGPISGPDTPLADVAGPDSSMTWDSPFVIEAGRAGDTNDDAPAPVDTPLPWDLADAVPDGEDATACSPLAYSGGTPLLSGKLYGYCPVDPTLSECKSSDVGATVYRDEICATATWRAHSDCGSWQRSFSEEVVVLRDRFGGCGWPITVNSVMDCGDHVSIAYSVTRPCATCDGSIPSAVVISLPNDPKPVHATATLVAENCAKP
jgi:hypothetical protein